MQNKTFFHILLAITIFWAGLNAMSYLGMGLLLPTVKEMLAENPNLLPEQFGIMMEQLFDTPRGFFVGSALLYLLEIIGAVLMWRLRWPGFHSYTLARLLLLLLPALFLGREFIGVGDIMMAALFVLVYYLLMRRLAAERKDPDDGAPTVGD